MFVELSYYHSQKQGVLSNLINGSFDTTRKKLWHKGPSVYSLTCTVNIYRHYTLHNGYSYYRGGGGIPFAIKYGHQKFFFKNHQIWLFLTSNNLYFDSGLRNNCKTMWFYWYMCTESKKQHYQYCKLVKKGGKLIKFWLTQRAKNLSFTS